MGWVFFDLSVAYRSLRFVAVSSNFNFFASLVTKYLKLGITVRHFVELIKLFIETRIDILCDFK